MNLDLFDFDLPEALIALRPAEPKDSARLLVVHGDGTLEDRIVRDLPDLVGPGDALVFNDTRVLPAALKGVRPARDENGRDVAVDLNLVERIDEASWRVLARPGRRLKAGDVLQFDGAFEAEILGGDESGAFDIRFSVAGEALESALDAHGAMPLPPYIARRRAADSQDRQDYQTSFAGDEAESVAAPTAGLHFTDALLERLDASGAAREMVRLHVGLGTFAPLKEEQIKDSRLHSEWRKLGAETAERLNQTRKAGGRVIPVGTTALRTLESSLCDAGQFIPTSGPTDIFIKPGDTVRSTDALMTNFHLPRSSLFMLVCAVMGTDVMQAAYAHAVREAYRFYSYGDACLLLPERA